MLTVVLKTLKKVLLSTVDLWIVAILLFLAALGFGAFMKDGAERSTPRGGALGRVAFGIGSMPVNLYRWFFSEPPHAQGMWREQRFHGRGGLIYASPPPGMTRQNGEAGYLVIARHVPLPETDAAERVSGAVIEIIDLNRRKAVHSWKLDLDYGRLSHFFSSCPMVPCLPASGA